MTYLSTNCTLHQRLEYNKLLYPLQNIHISICNKSSLPIKKKRLKTSRSKTENHSSLAAHLNRPLNNVAHLFPSSDPCPLRRGRLYSIHANYLYSARRRHHNTAPRGLLSLFYLDACRVYICRSVIPLGDSVTRIALRCRNHAAHLYRIRRRRHTV